MLSQALTVVLPLLAAVSAAPTASSTGASYYLQAQPLGKNPKAILDDYLSSYHSGAGENIVTLVARNDATKAFLNPSSGYQEFDLGTAYPWGFVMGGESDTAGASLVGIDAGSGDTGFSIPSAKAGLVWNGTGFGGWLACDVEGRTPESQLYWRNEKAVKGGKVEAACERVRLAPAYL